MVDLGSQVKISDENSLELLQKESSVRILSGNKMKHRHVKMREGSLILYGKKTDKNPKSVIYLRDINRVSRHDANSGAENGLICIKLTKFDDREEIISVKNVDERKVWMILLFKNMLQINEIRERMPTVDYSVMEEPMTSLKDKMKDTPHTNKNIYTEMPAAVKKDKEENPYDYADYNVQTPVTQHTQGRDTHRRCNPNITINFVKSKNCQISVSTRNSSQVQTMSAVSTSSSSDSDQDENDGEPLYENSSSLDSRSRNTSETEDHEDPYENTCVPTSNTQKSISVSTRNISQVQSVSAVSTSSSSNSDQDENDGEPLYENSSSLDYRSRNASTPGEEGHVTGNIQQTYWYGGSTDKESIKRCFDEKLPYTFLVRPSSDKVCLSLQLKLEEDPDPKNYKITIDNDRYSLLPRETFSSLEDLLAHYKTHPLPRHKRCLGHGYNSPKARI